MNTLILESNEYSNEALSSYRSLGNVFCLEGPLHDFSESDAEAISILVIRLKYRMDRALLNRFPNLKFIVSPTTGLDHIDLPLVQQRGIKVISLKGETAYLDRIVATAELTWGLILALNRKIPQAHADVLKARWNRDPFVGFDLRGKVLGILGFGRLGRQIAGYGKAFGMQVMVHDIAPILSTDPIISVVSRDEVLRDADVLTLHLPLDSTTERSLTRECLRKMKPSAILINTSRGAIVDEQALLAALQENTIRGAALDVLADELRFDESSLKTHPLLQYARSHSNLILTPHIGGASADAMRQTEVFVAQKLLHCLNEC
ncbi:MAG: NAD(P)-dependent oxidoreductase [Puniceicoccaceae bacterium]